MIKSYKSFYISIYVVLAIFFNGCHSSPKTLLVLHPKDETGIDFANTIFESDTFNIFKYDYIYNGGGVAVSDFNNDGLQDVFFTGNMVRNKLYLNEGKFKFRDVTDVANVNVPGKWNSGVTVVDINHDGWQDIYVCATMRKDSASRANMLFLNKGMDKNNIPVFEEVGAQYGIADTGYSLMASFFDYDRDGDLDLYVLTNKQSEEISATYRTKVIDGSSPTNDRLYRNNGNGTFTHVSKEAGIVSEGFGLGLAISDFNADGWPDIYVCNDFITNDLLYINNQDGTFTNQSPRWMAHHSMFSMGNDAADFNNDGLVDLITMDMLPETNQRKKTMINNKSYLTYINNERFGYEYQYMRNMLHLNNSLGDSIGFSEIGQMSGIFQTEWSWSALFADFDNDGYKDLFITNGFPKDITDKDFVAYRQDVGAYVSHTMLLDSVPVVRIPNYAYKNNGDLTFRDVSKQWGITQPSFSNGAVYADLDNDGDLDYIVNNINEEAFVYENTLYSKGNKSDTHYLRIKLVGPTGKHSVGAKIMLYYDSGKIQFFEQTIARGYLSSVESTIHAGLGNAVLVDSITIQWPDGKQQRLKNVNADQVLVIEYNPDVASRPFAKKSVHPSLVFQDRTEEVRLIHDHDEQDKIDFNIQRTLPHKFTQSGPGLAVGDLNGDQLDDLIVGGSSGFPTSYFLQQADGTFSKPGRLQDGENKIAEDEGLLLFDADNDGDQDLYIVSGSIESEPFAKDYQDRFYRNAGQGKFELDTLALPKINASGSCVRAADFDGDDDLDLFVGGRVVPASYPYPAESYILKNENGNFRNSTSEICPELQHHGMITDAMFTDFDNDGKIDIVVVGEFMPITFLKNMGATFVKVKNTGLENYLGWWNSVAGGDFDRDGDVDYIAGNYGQNNGYQVSVAYPLHAYAKDFDGNGSVDAILACYIKESLTNDERKLYAVHFWDEINSQSPRFRQQFSKYKQYSKVTLNELLSETDLKDALKLTANYFETSFIENLGNGKFKITALPRMAQIAPVNGLAVDDLNMDGTLDVLMIGNDFGNEVFAGRHDAFTGLVLLGDGKNKFTVITAAESKFYVPGDAKSLVKISGVQNDLYVATRNNNTIKAFSITPDQRNTFIPNSLDAWAELVFVDGKKQKIEFYYGAGYLSQSSRTIRLPDGVVEIIVYDATGESRKSTVKKP